jgi:integrase
MEILMPRPRPPHLHREVTRHGKTVWYVRLDHGPRIRIKHPYGSTEFTAAYRAIIAGDNFPSVGSWNQEIASAPDQIFTAQTLGWAIARYRQSAAWTQALKPGTRVIRDPVLTDVCQKAGTKPLSKITRAVIEAGIAKRAPNPARHFLAVLRGLFAWLVEAQLCGHDPTAGLKVIVPKSDGHPPWPDTWCRAFEARWPHGSRERQAYEIIYWTGLRTCDAVRLGRQHIKNNVVSLKTQKRDKWVHFALDELPALKAVLEAARKTALTFITGVNGQKMHEAALSMWFRRASRAAGVPGSAHGLRKTRATLIVEAGGTESEVAAYMGFGPQMAQLYTKSRDEALLAKRAAAKLQEANNNRTAIPAPIDKVRTPA